MILSTFGVLAGAPGFMYWMTKIVFILAGLAFIGGGGLALKNKDDPNQTITPPKAIAMLVVGGIVLLIGLFFMNIIPGL